MLQLAAECIIGLDLAGLVKNPSGVAVLTEKNVQASLVHSDSEILEIIEEHKPVLVAIDAPLNEPKRFLRTVDRQMLRCGYKVFPPNFMHMRQLTLRAVHLNRQYHREHIGQLRFIRPQAVKHSKFFR